MGTPGLWGCLTCGVLWTVVTGNKQENLPVTDTPHTMMTTAMAMQCASGWCGVPTWRAFASSRFHRICATCTAVASHTAHTHAGNAHYAIHETIASCAISGRCSCQRANLTPRHTALQELPQASRPQDRVLQADHHPRASIQHPHRPRRYVQTPPRPIAPRPQQPCLACLPMRAPPHWQPCWVSWASFLVCKPPACALSLTTRPSRWVRPKQPTRVT